MYYCKTFITLFFLSLLIPQIASANRAACSLKVDRSIPRSNINDITIKIKHTKDIVNLGFSVSNIVTKHKDFDHIPISRELTVKSPRDRLLHQCIYELKAKDREGNWNRGLLIYDGGLINYLGINGGTDEGFYEDYETKIDKNSGRKITLHIKRKADPLARISVSFKVNFIRHWKYFAAYGGDKKLVKADQDNFNKVSTILSIINETDDSTCIVSGDKVSILASTRQYLSVKNDNRLRADKTKRWSEELFILTNQSRSEGCLENGDKIDLKSSDGRWVTASPSSGVYIDTDPYFLGIHVVVHE